MAEERGWRQRPTPELPKPAEPTTPFGKLFTTSFPNQKSTLLICFSIKSEFAHCSLVTHFSYIFRCTQLGHGPTTKCPIPTTSLLFPAHYILPSISSPCYLFKQTKRRSLPLTPEATDTHLDCFSTWRMGQKFTKS